MQRVATLFVTVLFLVSSQAEAQFLQYNPPGDFQSLAESREELFKREMEGARWRLGRLYVSPWFAIRDLTYIENDSTISAGGGEADLSATVGAGLDAYLPLGGDFVLGAYVRPEYVWWQDNDARRRLNGASGLGIFGNLGRIGIEASAERTEHSRVYSREVEERVNQRWDDASAEVTVDLGKRIGWFVRGEALRFETIEDDPLLGGAFDGLDRDETAVQTGLGFFIRDQFRLGLGVEKTGVDFDRSVPFDRSNTGDGVFFELEYSNPRFTARGRLTDRTVDPVAPGSFRSFDGQTGFLDLSVRPLGPLQLELSERQNLSFSISESNAFFRSTISTIAVRSALGSRAGLRAFYEMGELNYEGGQPDTPDRIDDLSGEGITLDFTLGRAHIAISASRTKYDSNFADRDRTVTRLRTSLNFGIFDDSSTGPWN
jgi:hypothetical protein